MRRFALCSMLVGCVVLAAAFAAHSAGGLRVGYGGGPEQFVIGAQVDVGKIHNKIYFVPSIDAGFGDHLTTIAFNADIKAFLPLSNSSVSLYGLAGPSIVYWSPEKGKARTEIGVYLGGGVRAPLGNMGWYNLETRFGIGDVPDWRILLGVRFGGR